MDQPNKPQYEFNGIPLSPKILSGIIRKLFGGKQDESSNIYKAAL